MIDVSKTIAPKSDQLNADDLIGGAITVRVTKVSRMESPDQPIAINYDGDNGKPWKPCKSMRRVLVQIWGKDGQSYVGKSMTLYRDETVKFGGVDVGGIRISHMSDMKDGKAVTLALTASRANKKPFLVKPLAAQAQATTSQIDPAVKAAGDEAASKGVDAYTAWLGALDPAVKETVRGLHKEWSAKAKTVVVKEDDEISFDNDDDEAGM